MSLAIHIFIEINNIMCIHPPISISAPPCSLPQYSIKLGGKFSRLKHHGISSLSFSWQNNNYRNSGTVRFNLDLKKCTKKFFKTIRKITQQEKHVIIPITIKETSLDNKHLSTYKITSFLKSVSTTEMEHYSNPSAIIEFEVMSFEKHLKS